MGVISVPKLFSSVPKKEVLSISQAEHQDRFLRKSMGEKNSKVSEKMISTENSTWSLPRKLSKIRNYIWWAWIWLISEKAVCSHRETSPDSGHLYESRWLSPPPASGASSTLPRASGTGYTWLWICLFPFSWGSRAQGKPNQTKPYQKHFPSSMQPRWDGAQRLLCAGEQRTGLWCVLSQPSGFRKPGWPLLNHLGGLHFRFPSPL